MTKVSSNAGKHPYLRPDHGFLFDHLKVNKEGKKFAENVQVKVRERISSELYDADQKLLFYGDKVTFNREDYTVDYDAREFHWILRNDNDYYKTQILRETAHLVKVKESCN